MQRLCDAVGGSAQKRVCEPEFFEQRFMREEIDILEMVVRFVLAMDLLLRLAGVDAFQDAEAPAAEHMLGVRLAFARHSNRKKMFFHWANLGKQWPDPNGVPEFSEPQLQPLDGSSSRDVLGNISSLSLQHHSIF